MASWNKEDTFFCMICGEDMGPTNPRQLCGKTRCHNIPNWESFDMRCVREKTCCCCGVELETSRISNLCGYTQCLNKAFTLPERPNMDDVIENRCQECGVNMGYENPRQLCGKTRCLQLKK